MLGISRDISRWGRYKENDDKERQEKRSGRCIAEIMRFNRIFIHLKCIFVVLWNVLSIKPQHTNCDLKSLSIFGGKRYPISINR